ncbi:MAG: CheR family methyltransferase [Actinomycetes bacterium]
MDRDFEELLRYLKEARGFDFTGYKRTSLQRRVQRRMHDLGVATFEDYLDVLQLNADELTALFNTILINVTGFFRDPEAWAYLEHHVLPGLIEASGGGPLRAWSAGCASGEEAYSLAMLFARQLGLEEFRKRVKIYATDVDEEALAHGRTATYSDREVRGVPPELLAEFFESSGQRHSVRKEFRRAVIFGRNDLVQDAPISHVQLLLCRNTLMYLNAETQGRVLQRLNFALNPQGVLFLGKAEMLLGHSTLFAPLDLKRRFFVKVDTGPTRNRSGFLGHQPEPADPPAEDRLHAETLAASPIPQLVIDRQGHLVIANHRAQTLCNIGSRDLAGRSRTSRSPSGPSTCVTPSPRPFSNGVRSGCTPRNGRARRRPTTPSSTTSRSPRCSSATAPCSARPSPSSTSPASGSCSGSWSSPTVSSRRPMRSCSR